MDSQLWVEEELTKKMEEEWQHLLPLPPKNIKVNVRYASATKGTHPFWVEADVHNDTVLKLREKIHMRIRSRTFKNMILRLERTNGTLLLLDHDQLLINCGFKPSCHVLIEQGEQFTFSDPVVVKVFSFKSTLLVEMKLNDTVLKLKEKIQETNEGMEMERMVLLRSDGGTKYDDDHQLLGDCGVKINRGALEIWVYAYVTSLTRRLKVMVLPKDVTPCIMIPVEVDASDQVKELRKVLEKLRLPHNVVPRDGLYGFAYKEAMMNDRMPFEWHQVQQGDTIQLLSDALSV